MILAEALIYLEDLEVFEGSYSESDIDIKHQYYTKIYIQPPVGPNRNISDIDPSDEDEPSIDKLSENQLLASAILEIKRIGKAEIVSVEETHTDTQDSLIEIKVASSTSTNTQKPKMRFEEEGNKKRLQIKNSHQSKR